ncbi:MAG: hypothetical protein ACKO0Z_12155 [Betaproteobacteria bacterium]
MKPESSNSKVGRTFAEAHLLATPRTDSNEQSWRREYERSRECGWPSIGYVVDADFARELERENKALRDALNLARQHIASEFGFENWRIEQVDKVANDQALP